MKASVSTRLRRALGHADMTIRRLQMAIPESVKGHSYASVHSYVKRDVDPPLEFLRAAAKVLDVRESWLVSGQGEMTETEERAREGWSPELQAKITEELKFFTEGPEVVQSMFWEVVRRWAAHAARHRGDLGDEEILAVVRQLNTWAFGPPELGLMIPMSEQRLTEYRIALLGALMTLYGEPEFDLTSLVGKP